MTLTERHQTLNFINDYRRCSSLWNPAEKGYTNKAKRTAAYNALGRKYDMTVSGVKGKIKTLRTYFLKEQQKLVTSAAEGGEEVYKSPWFAYDALSFIGHRRSSRKDAPQRQDYSAYDAADEGKGVVEDSLTEQDMFDESFIPNGPADMLVQVETETEEAKDEASAVKTTRTLKRKLDEDWIQEEPATGLLASSRLEKDECGIFGELVACQLRKLGARNRAIARNKIQNVIFELEMQEMDSVEQGAPDD